MFLGVASGRVEQVTGQYQAWVCFGEQAGQSGYSDFEPLTFLRRDFTILTIASAIPLPFGGSTAMR